MSRPKDRRDSGPWLPYRDYLDQVSTVGQSGVRMNLLGSLGGHPYVLYNYVPNHNSKNAGRMEKQETEN